RCHRLNMKTYIINGSEVSRLSVAIHGALYGVPISNFPLVKVYLSVDVLSSIQQHYVMPHNK
ncbi:hypothetical protein, partial [Enterobacter roggenkampii]|uniref:hypothetical protein n=1 Tax=Enterobacter roggenkampii TaxID=1812935 RepID=UPI001ABB95E5